MSTKHTPGPWMLEALIRIQQILTCESGLLSFTGGVKDLMVELIGDDVVRKAIAKATGEQS